MAKFHARRLAAVAVGLGCLFTYTGCVERRYTIRTDPPGALVVVNGEEIGPSPASRSFYFYGDREITLIRDGYKTETFIQPINAPWFDNYLTEFFTENVIPMQMRDDREFKYTLKPYVSSPEGALRDRAESLRTEAQVLPKPRRTDFWGWLGF